MLLASNVVLRCSIILLLRVRVSPRCFTEWEGICKGYGVRGDLNTTPASKPHIFKLHFVKNTSFSLTRLVGIGLFSSTVLLQGYTAPHTVAFFMHCALTTHQVG